MEAFLSRLPDARKHSGGFRASCPGHGGTSGNSLSVHAGERGVLYYCFVGCDWKQILNAMDLRHSDTLWDASQKLDEKPRPFDRRGAELESLMCARRLMGEEAVLARCRNERAWAKGALEKLEVGWDGERLTLPVRDKDGKLHDVLRYDPFTKGKRKMLAGEGRSRMPFPTIERLDTNTLWIVEGEGTAISMASIGLTAVGLPGAVARQSGDVRRPGKFEGVGWHAAWARRFSRFKFCVLLPDGDDVGRLLMETVRFDLEKEDVTANIVDLGREGGYDVGDWLKVAKTGLLRKQARDLLEMLVRTVREQPAQAATARDLLKAFEEWQLPKAEVPLVPVSSGPDWS